MPKLQLRKTKSSAVAPIPTIPSLSPEFLDFKKFPQNHSSTRRAPYLRQRTQPSQETALPGLVLENFVSSLGLKGFNQLTILTIFLN